MRPVNVSGRMYQPFFFIRTPWSTSKALRIYVMGLLHDLILNMISALATPQVRRSYVSKSTMSWHANCRIWLRFAVSSCLRMSLKKRHVGCSWMRSFGHENWVSPDLYFLKEVVSPDGWSSYKFCRTYPKRYCAYGTKEQVPQLHLCMLASLGAPLSGLG